MPPIWGETLLLLKESASVILRLPSSSCSSMCIHEIPLVRSWLVLIHLLSFGPNNSAGWCNSYRNNDIVPSSQKLKMTCRGIHVWSYLLIWQAIHRLVGAVNLSSFVDCWSLTLPNLPPWMSTIWYYGFEYKLDFMRHGEEFSGKTTWDVLRPVILWSFRLDYAAARTYD